MDRKRTLLWLGAAAIGSAALAQLLPAQSPVSAPAVHATSERKADRASERFAALPSRDPIGKPQGELFGPRSWTPAAPAASAAQRSVVQAPPKPVPPPLPYRIAGQVMQEDGMRLVLTKGDRVFEVRPGETLDDGFRIESIAPHAVTFVYTPLGVSQEVAVAGTGLDLPPLRGVAAAPRQSPQAAAPVQKTAAPVPVQQTTDAPSQPAQLRFEGPQEVRAGKPFDVALKLTSPQPVRAMPMQLSFDAKRLEPLAVRPGDLFAGGSFTYRVNPSGSIFVGASGSGRAAADTNFLIVTFRPIASGPAELKVSSLLVQGAAGRTILHEPPQTFRAAVLQ